MLSFPIQFAFNKMVPWRTLLKHQNWLQCCTRTAAFMAEDITDKHSQSNKGQFRMGYLVACKIELRSLGPCTCNDSR